MYSSPQLLDRKEKESQVLTKSKQNPWFFKMAEKQKEDLIKAIDDATEILTKERIKEIEEEIISYEFTTIQSIEESLKKLLETDMETEEVYSHASKILDKIQLGKLLQFFF